MANREKITTPNDPIVFGRMVTALSRLSTLANQPFYLLSFNGPLKEEHSGTSAIYSNFYPVNPESLYDIPDFVIPKDFLLEFGDQRLPGVLITEAGDYTFNKIDSGLGGTYTLESWLFNTAHQAQLGRIAECKVGLADNEAYEEGDTYTLDSEGIIKLRRSGEIAWQQAEDFAAVEVTTLIGHAIVQGS